MDKPVKNLNASLVFDFNHLEVQKLISWLEWDWSDHYLEPHKSRRNINTSSVIQARQPINKKSVGGWKSYAKMLEPAREVLATSTLFESELYGYMSRG